uniref:hypothetical protein n=1 Tax=Pelagibacter ubique TaxID=198252 RepID=UPI000A9770FE
NYEKFVSDPKKTYSIIEKKLDIKPSTEVNKFIDETIKINNNFISKKFPTKEVKRIYDNLNELCIN